VKNYYQRQVDAGRSDLEDVARTADGRKSRGESTGPAPTPTVPIKRRYDGPGAAIQRSAMPTIDTAEDPVPAHQPMMMQNASSPKQSTASRFPALQAGPIPQTSQPPRTTSAPSKSTPSQHQPQQWPQQMVPNQRGPQLGYFNPDRERPILQAASTQRQPPSMGQPDPTISHRSQIAAYEAQRERELALQVEQQVKLRLKQEMEMQNMNQYEQYSTQPQQPSIVARSRNEEPSSIYGNDMRRTAPIQQYNPRNTQPAREVGNDNLVGGPSGLVSNPPPQSSRPSMTAPHIQQEPPTAPRPQPPAVSAVRQQETVRKTSSIMSLLNDEPSELKVPPPKRTSDGPPAPVQPSPSTVTQQPLYPPARSLSGSQPGQIRSKTSGDMHGPSHNYPHSAGSSQPPIRVVESPYSAVVQSQAQARSQIGSAMDSQSAKDRDGYAHQQYNIHRQQQPAANSPQLGPQYQPAPQSHRHMAFGPSASRTASPPSQYAPLHASRPSNFDAPPYGRHSTSSSMPPQMHYSPGPSGPSVTMPYQAPPLTTHQSFSTVRFPGHQSAPTSQGQSQMSQHQQPTQPTYSPLPAQPVQQHPQPGVSSRSYSPSAYDAREPSRPGPQQQNPGLDRLHAEHQLHADKLRADYQRRQLQLQQQQQQQREEDPYNQRRLEDRRYEDSRRG
jgi:hypothetical protein